MSSKEFCASGQHVYKEIDIVKTVFEGVEAPLWIVTACSKCDSRFLKMVERPLP